MSGTPPIVAIWAALLICCFAAPVPGFVLPWFGKTGAGVLIALPPPIAAAEVAAFVVYLL